jgi:hypothetical protein
MKGKDEMEGRPKRVLLIGSDLVGGPGKHRLYFDLLMGTNYSESDPTPNPETESPDKVREEDEVGSEER